MHFLLCLSSSHSAGVTRALWQKYQIKAIQSDMVVLTVTAEAEKRREYVRWCLIGGGSFTGNKRCVEQVWRVSEPCTQRETNYPEMSPTDIWQQGPKTGICVRRGQLWFNCRDVNKKPVVIKEITIIWFEFGSTRDVGSIFSTTNRSVTETQTFNWQEIKNGTLDSLKETRDPSFTHLL